MNELVRQFNPETPETYVPTQNEERVALLLAHTKGNIAQVAHDYPCARWTIYKYIQNSPYLQYIFKDSREKRLDIAEGKLDEAVSRGEGWAVCFILKTLGKERGYVERVDNTGSIEHRHTIENWKEEADKKLKELEEQSASRNDSD